MLERAAADKRTKRMNEKKKTRKQKQLLSYELKLILMYLLFGRNTAMNWQTTSHTEQLAWSHTHIRAVARVGYTNAYTHITVSNELHQRDQLADTKSKWCSTLKIHRHTPNTFCRKSLDCMGMDVCVWEFFRFFLSFFCGEEGGLTTKWLSDCDRISGQCWPTIKDGAQNLFGHHFDN